MRLNNICKSYENGKIQVFTDLCLEIGDGAATWIMGSSGAGKTTLLRILAGLEDYSGEITGADGRCSFMFQENRLFEQLSAADNICLTGVTREKAEEYLVKLGLSDEDIRRPVSELSGGMKRRTALIRTMLYPDGEIILMDEPFNGLDKENRSRAAELINELRNSRTLIAVTHHISDAELIGGNIINL